MKKQLLTLHEIIEEHGADALAEEVVVPISASTELPPLVAVDQQASTLSPIPDQPGDENSRRLQSHIFSMSPNSVLKQVYRNALLEHFKTQNLNK